MRLTYMYAAAPELVYIQKDKGNETVIRGRGITADLDRSSNPRGSDIFTVIK